MKSDFNSIFKKGLPYICAIAIFIIIAFVYCKPVLQGKVVAQSDRYLWEGMANEINQYYEETGEIAYWTNSIFGGMPSYQINATSKAAFYMAPLRDLGHLFFGSVIGMLIGYLLGFFILMRSFNINKWLSIVGSIAVTFSSYFFIIIAAGHNSKVLALGYLAPVMAGFVLMFRKKYLWGIILTLIYSAVGIIYHPQMTYYIFLMLGLFGVAEVFIHIKEKRIKDLFIALALFVICVAIGAGTKYSALSGNLEYMSETIRGGHSDLEQVSENEKDSKGLDLEYATQWSYGINETMTLLIPNFMGGSSSYNLGENSHIYKTMVEAGVNRRDAKSIAESAPTYWGEQPFTSGPVYVGAIVCLLFIMGLMLVKGPYKWAILIATLFSIMLSWGKNFMPLTEFFYNYFPLYNKFRAVSSALIVAEIAMPLLGFLAIKEIMDKRVSKEEIFKAIKVSTIITGGLCLIVALFGPMFLSFTSSYDAHTLQQMPNWFISALLEDREAMLRGDAFRSLIYILLGAAAIWFFATEKLKFKLFVPILGILILSDMFVVDKRFFNDDNFVSTSKDREYFAIQPYEEEILKDDDLYFRVFNTTSNTFNDSRTSYRLHSIGGYHAAKLRRYQDLIDEHLSKMHANVYNMLNTKYLIVMGEDGIPHSQYNPDHFGNGWFVDKVHIVNSAREESDALNTIDLRREAVTDSTFAKYIENKSTPQDSSANIVLTKYSPVELEYATSSSAAKTAVFSDIYYPHGWKAYIDGEFVEHFRVNYLLRGLNIPAGEHTVRFEFVPDSVIKKDNISIVMVFIVYSLVAAIAIYSIIRSLRNKRK